MKHFIRQALIWYIPQAVLLVAVPVWVKGSSPETGGAAAGLMGFVAAGLYTMLLSWTLDLPTTLKGLSKPARIVVAIWTVLMLGLCVLAIVKAPEFAGKLVAVAVLVVFWLTPIYVWSLTLAPRLRKWVACRDRNRRQAAYDLSGERASPRLGSELLQHGRNERID